MISYVIAENPDDRVLRRASGLMKEGGLVAFPTDTSWVIGTAIQSKEGIERLHRLRGIPMKRHLTVLCPTISEASRYAIIPNEAFKLIKRHIPGPYTFILMPTRDLPRSIRDYRKDGEIGIRFPKKKLCDRLLHAHGDAIITVSLTHAMLGIDEEESSLMMSYMIEDALSNDLAMIIDPGDVESDRKSSIVSFVDEGIPHVLRAGAGDVSAFEGH